jgi:hypothetical protein
VYHARVAQLAWPGLRICEEKRVERQATRKVRIALTAKVSHDTKDAGAYCRIGQILGRPAKTLAAA